MSQKINGDDVIILYSDNYIGYGWPFGKAHHLMTLENYAEVIDSLPPNSIVFGLMDCFEEEGSIGISGLRYLVEKGHRLIGCTLEFFLITYSKIQMKQLFQQNGVSCPKGGIFQEVIKDFTHYPAFIKPDESCSAQGIEKESVVSNREEAIQRFNELSRRFPRLLIE